jgi:hypothetical protein
LGLSLLSVYGLSLDKMAEDISSHPAMKFFYLFYKPTLGETSIKVAATAKYS